MPPSANERNESDTTKQSPENSQPQLRLIRFEMNIQFGEAQAHGRQASQQLKHKLTKHLDETLISEALPANIGDISSQFLVRIKESIPIYKYEEKSGKVKTEVIFSERSVRLKISKQSNNLSDILRKGINELFEKLREIPPLAELLQVPNESKVSSEIEDGTAVEDMLASATMSTIPIIRDVLQSQTFDQIDISYSGSFEDVDPKRELEHSSNVDSAELMGLQYTYSEKQGNITINFIQLPTRVITVSVAQADAIELDFDLRAMVETLRVKAEVQYRKIRKASAVLLQQNTEEE